MKKKTYATKKEDIKASWHHIDAKGKVLGRLASDVSRLLQGKHKVNFVPYLNCGDKVVITNAEKIVLTGNKNTDKMYYSHTGNVDGFRQTTADKLRASRPTSLIKIAVNGMLPKNKLRKVRMANLKIIVGEENPYG